METSSQPGNVGLVIQIPAMDLLFNNNQYLLNIY